jgi:hypothetical protein
MMECSHLTAEAGVNTIILECCRSSAQSAMMNRYNRPQARIHYGPT